VSKAFRPFGIGRSHDPHENLIIQRGAGCRVWDSEGKEYLDFVGGYSALNLGHSHPRLIEVAQEQLQQLTFCTGGNHRWRSELEQSLSQMVWNSLQSNPPKNTQLCMERFATTGTAPLKVWLSSTGARAVEIAWKIAFANRPGCLMRFDLSYHGRSLATSMISDTARSLALQGASIVNHTSSDSSWSESDGVVAFPRCGSNCDGKCSECTGSLESAERWLEKNSDTMSALILEPAIGARGYHFACGRYYRSLVELAHRFGLLVISDEVQMGLGRLGSMVASHAEGWFPDLIVFGKSLGGGIAPISAVVGQTDIMDRLPQGIESETFASNAFACRIAIEVLSMLNDAIFLERVRRIGESFRQSLRKGLPSPCKVDGCGLCTVIDLSRVDNEPAEAAWRWVSRLREQGLLVHLTGVHRDRVAILPPLNVDEDILEQAIDILTSTWTTK